MEEKGVWLDAQPRLRLPFLSSWGAFQRLWQGWEAAVRHNAPSIGNEERPTDFDDFILAFMTIPFAPTLSPHPSLSPAKLWSKGRGGGAVGTRMGVSGTVALSVV